LVGVDAYSFLAREHILLNSLTEIIKGARVEELPERISAMITHLKDVERELAQVRTSQILAQSSSLVTGAEKINDFSIIAHDMGPNLSGDELRVIALDLRSKLTSGVVALASAGEEKVVLVVAVDDVARKNGAKAGVLVKAASAILGGGGGGKDDFAQGGGANSAKIAESLDAIKNLLRSS